MTDIYRRHLLERLDALYGVIESLRTLPRFFDVAWRNEIESEIRVAELQDGFRSDRCPLFFFFKDDPRYLRTLDNRLSSLVDSYLKPDEVERKFREIHVARFMSKQLDHFFELSTLGFFAERGQLLDIEVPIGSGTVDGIVRVYKRPALLEVTNTTQELLARGPGVFSMAVETLTGQVELKVRKKGASGRQLALAAGRPAILALGLNPFGAGQLDAQWALEECFARPEFGVLSAVLVSDSWRFLDSTLHLNPLADVPLATKEIEELGSLLHAAARG